MEEINKEEWSLTLGFYPGILFGMRTYHEKTQRHVFIHTFILI